MSPLTMGVGLLASLMFGVWDEVPLARAYLNEIVARLDRLEAQVPRIAEAADAASQALVAGRPFGVRGSPGLAGELSRWPETWQSYRGGGGERRGMVLYMFGLHRRRAAWMCTRFCGSSLRRLRL